MNKMRQAIAKSALAPARLNAEGGEQSFCFSEDFIGFGGHFPGYPILPAILQTLLAQLLAEQIAGEKLQFQALTRAKFIRQLRPGERIEVIVRCQEDTEQLRCTTQLKVADEAAARFTLVLSRGERP